MRRLSAVVFNNPFDSFHDTVAEAKEEREQLDRLLTISTPRERLLVGAIAALLVILAAWVLFGNVHRSVALEGVLIEPAEISEGNRSVQALVWIHRGVAPDIAIGMPALLELAVEGGTANGLEGEVAAISAVALSEVPAFGSSAPVSIHRVDIALDESLDFGSIAAMECRVVIEVGRQSPLALLRTAGMRQS
ncbi:MAG: hypothetical protein F4029_06135 [Gammaproteobacteria bacterium]|nr:hypothetical protein [Gammaproteobacteria bacterium]MYF28433.1 hypothetical protein [Gammaproteobacteria bacterium]MYK45789.1 hypothetical protein [Gammaproteobacteria bacterium]